MADDPQPVNALAALIQTVQKALTVPPDAQVIHQQHLQEQMTPAQRTAQDQAAQQARAKSDATDERQFESQRAGMVRGIQKKFADPPKTKPAKNKQRQVKQYEAEPRPSQNPLQHLSDVIQQDPGERIGRALRQERIDTGNEAWTPMVGKQQPGDVRKYKEQRRLAEQNERGVFGQRLPPSEVHAKMEAGALLVGETKLKTGERLTQNEKNALVKAGRLPGDPASSPEAAMAGTMPELEPVVEMVATRLASRFPKMAGALGMAGAKSGAAAEEEAIATEKATTGVARAAKPGAKRAGSAKVEPPAQQAVSGEKRIALPPGKPPPEEAAGPPPSPRGDDRPPLPPTKESPVKSRAAQARKKAAADEVNAKTEGPGPAPKTKPKAKPKAPPPKTSAQDVADTGKAKAPDKDLYDKLDESIKTSTTKRQARFRGKLPKNLQSRFDKMTPTQKEAYMKDYKAGP